MDETGAVVCRLECLFVCIKSLFNCRRLDSVTFMLSELGLPNFRTLFNDCVHNVPAHCEFLFFRAPYKYSYLLTYLLTSLTSGG